ncbi:hypothetical protein BD769DRAFT_1665391 [Suillus cothurnatus]|nr:hypothetical protein BD769DRAFT_1665391 [Suillus cothurnatus]
MSSHYNLRSQRSILSSQEPTIPGSLAESPLTESTTHQTAIVSPAESRKAEADESVLRPGHSYSNMVQMRSGTPWPEAGLKEPGPSNPDDGPSKGKNPDPHNWGNLDLEESELDPGAQLEALRAWARSRKEPREATNAESETTSEDRSDTMTRDPVQEAIKAAVKQATWQYKEEICQLQSELKSKHTSQGKCPKTPMTKGTKESRVSFDPIQEMVGKAIRHPLKAHGRHPTPPAVDATAQITKKSYLGRAFKEVRRPEKQRSSWHNKDDSQDSSPSSSSSEYSSSTSSSSTEESSLEESSSSKYNGSADSCAFHRFMMEGKAYLEDSQVPRSSQVRVLARHLKGKAHDFYTRQVSDQPGEWGLSRFLTELFNYCFPLDYRSKQRKKLYRYYQGDKRVRDYIEKVVKFWFGLNTTIQKELYKMHLNPEVSTLRKVQHMAEIIELAHSASNETRGKDKGHKSDKKSGAHMDKGNRSSKRNKGPSNESRDQGSNVKMTGSQQGGCRTHPGPGGKHPRDRTRDEKRSVDPRGAKLSKEEHDKLMSEGHCFVCKETGHMSRQCPKRMMVPSGVTDSDGVRQQRQLLTPIKVVLDQDRLKRSFVRLWTPTGSDQSRLLQDLELIRGQQG